MAFAITPSLGAPISINDGMVGATPYWDINYPTISSPQIGSIMKGSDGRDYVYAQASAAVASNVAVILTEPAMTFATGAGAWVSPLVTGGTPINGWAWIQRSTI
jgi:hypothetical protein